MYFPKFPGEVKVNAAKIFILSTFYFENHFRKIERNVFLLNTWSVLNE